MNSNPSTLLVWSVSLLTASSLSGGEGSDWPHWRGLDGTGIAPEIDWLDSGQELWKVEVGLGYSQPSVVGDRLYTRGFDARREVDQMLCLNAETGEELWRHEHPSRLLDNMHGGGSLTTPAVADGAVYVQCRVGPLFAFEADSGELRWERDVAEDFGIEIGSFGLCASPLRAGELLIVNVGKTLALDPVTGATVWSTEDYGYSYSTPTAFRWEGRDCLAVFNGAGLVVLELETGKEIALHPWTSNYNVNCATPIVIEDRIFISTGYDDKGCAMLRLGEEGLELMWENKAMRNKMNGCVLLDGFLYGFDHGQLKCMDLNGNTLWNARGLGTGTLIAAGERLVVLSEDGELVVAPASAEGFEPAYRAAVLAEGPCWSTPVLSHGRIYCRNQKGTLVARDHRPERAPAGE